VSALKSLVVSNANDFKYSHVVISNSESSISEIAMGGRNYNGQVSLAFVFGGVGASLHKKANSATCSNHNCEKTGHYTECDCEVDGTYLPRCRSHDSNECQKLWGWSSRRGLTSAERAAVQKDMQYALFAKVNAEATLLENELRNGLSDTLADNAMQSLVVSEMVLDDAIQPLVVLEMVVDNATQPLII